MKTRHLWSFNFRAVVVPAIAARILKTRELALTKISHHEEILPLPANTNLPIDNSLQQILPIGSIDDSLPHTSSLNLYAKNGIRPAQQSSRKTSNQIKTTLFPELIWMSHSLANALGSCLTLAVH